MREAFGIEIDDIDFSRRVIRFHPNTWRRLKTPRSTRVVPLRLQLAEILSEYLGRYRSRLNRLLLPSERLLARAKEGMITDSRKMLDTLGSRVGFQPGEVRWNELRHGYATARLQTLDRGAPMSTFTVARELGTRAWTWSNGSTATWAKCVTAQKWWSSEWSSISTGCYHCQRHWLDGFAQTSARSRRCVGRRARNSHKATR